MSDNMALKYELESLNGRKWHIAFFLTITAILIYQFILSDFIWDRATLEGRRALSITQEQLLTKDQFSGGLVKAAVVILCRNSELKDLKETLTNFELRFNSRFKYPYVFLNDVAFTEEFKNVISTVSDSKMEFGLIDKEHWDMPQSINVTRVLEYAETNMKYVPYSQSTSYRNMCRFNSGYFFRHPLLADYEYYWRVEPGVRFYCDIPYDPFLYMKLHNKKYAFNIVLKEFEETVPTLWGHSMDFAKANPSYIPEDNFMHALTDKDGGYNMCHFWSNFEIASLHWLRGEAYMKYFDYLNSKNGFYYERWGDAPVHSIAAAMLLTPKELHYFYDIGYLHPPMGICPKDNKLYRARNCECDQNKSTENNRCTRIIRSLLG